VAPKPTFDNRMVRWNKQCYNSRNLRLAGLDSLKHAILAPSHASTEERAAERESPHMTRTSHRLISRWLPIGSLIILYSGFAIAYNVKVPLYEAPDEHSHVAYVDALQRTGRIPDIPRIYEAVGPPFYHAVGAATLKIVGFSPPFIGLPENPNHATEANLWLHTPTENDLPYRGPVLSIHVLRGISMMFGIGTVVLVYLIASLLFPGRPLLAWAAGANTALLPQFAFVGGSVMNDTTLAFFSAAAVYSVLRIVKDGALVWVSVCAGSLALGFLTEAAMIVVAIVCALALLVSPLSWPRRGFALTAFVAASFAVAGWFYIRNWVEFGAIYPVEKINSGLGPPRPLTDPVYREVFLSTLQQSYWYTGGWMNVRVGGTMYQFLDVIAGMAFGGAILMIVRNKLSPFQQRGLLILGILFALAVFEVFWISVRISLESQGRFLFIAQPAIALLFALGINALFQRDSQRDHPAVLLLPAILFGLNIGIFTLTLPTYY